MSDKIFVGRGKEIETKYGPLLKLAFFESDLRKMLANLNERGWVNAAVKSMKTPTENQSHYVEIDNWKPEDSQPEEPEASGVTASDLDDLPF